MKIKVQVFASLKDYLDPQFYLELQEGATANEVRYRLLTEYPMAESILRKSKLAVNDCFVEGSYTLKDNEHILIIPPSSGG
ncbi:MAG: MoaD/ThiS family protein [Sporocytophaga sp.]|nr:MoaD/ThiS family protein [Sporocytophaga sp.]